MRQNLELENIEAMMGRELPGMKEMLEWVFDQVRAPRAALWI